MAHHIVVFINGERFPLMDDRRFHLAAYFPEGATLYDLSYAPPRPVPMSSFDMGVTAAKLRPFARYSANPQRPGIPAVVVHGVPEGVTPVQLGQFLELCLEGGYVEECNFFPTTTTDTGVSTRAYAILSFPGLAQTLVDTHHVEWSEYGALMTFEYLDVPRPMYGRRRHRGEPPLADPSITLAAPAKVGGSTFQQQRVANAPPADGLAPITYFVQLIEDDEPVLAKWCTEGTCVVPMKHAIKFAEKAVDTVVHIVFAIRARREVFGFGQYMGFQANKDDPDTAIIGVEWLQYGAGVKKPEVDSCVSADVATDIVDGSIIRPDWAFDICAAVDRTLQRPSVRAAPPLPSMQPATAIVPPPPPPPSSSAPPMGSHGHAPNPGAGAWHPPHQHDQHQPHHHHHHHHHQGGPYGGPPPGPPPMGGGGGGYGGPPPPGDFRGYDGGYGGGYGGRGGGYGGRGGGYGGGRGRGGMR